MLNAVAGFLTSLINIYTARDGDWSIMAVLTVVVTAGTALASLVFLAFYFVKLAQVRYEHEQEELRAQRV